MLGENLKTIRKRRGLSQEELAARIHVVRQTVSKWEKNLSVPDADTLVRLAEALEVTVADLLGEGVENDAFTSTVAEQLSRIAEQLAVKNRRARRVWRIVLIALATAVILQILALFLYSALPDSVKTGEPEITVSGRKELRP